MSDSSTPDSSTPATPPTPTGPVLVCGGAGYIGSHCVALLQQRGVEVIVFDNLSTGHRESITAPLVVGDLADRGAIASVLRSHRPSAVVHFAALCYVGESVTDPAKYYRENVHYTWNLLEEMRAADVKDIVFSSTCATYGEPREVPIPDDHPQDPINPYGRTKLHMEHMMRDYSRAYGLRYAALRYFNGAGAASAGCIGEDHHPETHLIPLVLEVALGKREKILVFGDDYDTRDGTCIRDYIHVDDIGDAQLRALCHLQAGKGDLECHLGRGNGFTVMEIIQAAREITGHAIPTEIVARREGDPAMLVAGGTKARDVLGWTPARGDVHDVIRDAWAFHSARPGGYANAGSTG